MRTSQSDVDKVMAAFGAAPLDYRPNQEAAEPSDVGSGGVPSRNAGDPQATPSPSARAEERILPGAGGRVREIFPLLWRAIPIVGDLKIGSTKRPGDEVPEPVERTSPAEQQLEARIRAVTAPPAAVGPPPAPRTTPPAAVAPPPAPVTTPRLVYPTPTEMEAIPRPATPAAAPAAWPFRTRDEPPAIAAPGAPPQPLKSHAELVRSLVATVPAAPPPPPNPPAETAALYQPVAPQPAMPPQVPPQQAAPYPPPPPPGYPAYHQPQAAPPYPMPPPVMPWPQAPYPPPYGYPPPYPPPYPYGYPQHPPPGMAPYPMAPYPMPPVPAPVAAAPPPPAPPANAPPASAPPTSLSDIFAALHRAPAAPREEDKQG